MREAVRQEIAIRLRRFIIAPGNSKFFVENPLPWFSRLGC
jgi:hypothetical protein